MPTSSEEVRLALAALALLLLPGRALLSLLRLDRSFSGLQGWLVAVGLGAALPPLLFTLQAAIPGAPALGPVFFQIMILMAAIFLVADAWKRPERWRLERSEWGALLVLGLVVALRFWLAHTIQIPPLTDSLHHALLTKATAETGSLPTAMPVFGEILLHRYHLGLYALTGATTWIAGAEPHSALLWMGQLLNAVAAAGVYVVLDRYTSRSAAIIGLLATGFIGQMPNAYLGWGRFTQVAGQALLPFAWLLTWEWLANLHAEDRDKNPRAPSLCLGLAAVGLAAATMLVHLRVGLFLLPLLALTFLLEFTQARRERRAWSLLKPVGVAVLGSLLLLLPRYAEGAWIWLWGHWFLSLDGNTWSATDDLRALNAAGYFSRWETESLTKWVAPPLIVAASLVFGFIALVLKDRGSRRLGLLITSWMIVLLLMGNVHRLGLHVLNVLPLNSVLIFLYFPLAILLGCGIRAVEVSLPESRRRGWSRAALGFSVALAVLALPSRLGEVPDAHNLIEPGDLAAFSWIQENTPADTTFAIGSTTLFKSYPAGSDGGYWIPYFTGRKTVPGTMLLPLAPHSLRRAARTIRIQQMAGFENSKIDLLLARGVQYFYFSRAARGYVDAKRLAREPRLTLVYDDRGVQILKLLPRP